MMIVCKDCGSGDVQTVMWVRANTSEPVDHFASSWSEADANWCDGCDAHVELMHLTEGEATLMRLIVEAGVGQGHAAASMALAKEINITGVKGD